MYSGLDNSASGSYAYLKVFDVSGQNIGITSSTSLSYWIFPQSSATSNLVSGNNSSCVAIDMVFTDGSNLRDSGVTDQTGDRVHPAFQCGHLTMDSWNNVTANLGALSGKVIARIVVAYDQPANTGGYRGYVDDIAITSGSVINPTNTPVPTFQPPTNTPVPVNGHMFAPYIDVSPGSSSPIMQLASNGSGNKFYSLAFILGSGCNASWFGAFPMNTTEATAIGSRINELRAAGGDVIVSFGGAAAPELANVCPDAASLQAQYQSVVSKYNLKYVDFDIEDFNPTAIDLRNKALRGLEAANPGLQVHYTLGVLQSGFTSSQNSVLSNAAANGVRVDLVNIMAMDYGGAVSDMYSAAVSAAQNARSQLNGMGFGSTQLGITPMIGVNDSAGETFTLSNASSLVSWARSNGISLLAFWSVGRDNGGCPGGGAASASCSGVAQNTWDFSHIFQGF